MSFVEKPRYGFAPNLIDRRCDELIARVRGENANPVTVRWVEPKVGLGPRVRQPRYSKRPKS